MPGFPHAMPMHGLVGGLLIGLAAALMLLGNGRVAGCSGMFTRAAGLASTGAPRGVAIAFTLGLPIGAGIAAWLVDLCHGPKHHGRSLLSRNERRVAYGRCARHLCDGRSHELLKTGRRWLRLCGASSLRVAR